MRSACSPPGASLTRLARASVTWSSWPSGASPPWAMLWPTRCSNSALLASVWDWGNPATFPPPSKLWPSGSRRVNAHWLQASLTPAQILVPYWPRSSCPGSRSTTAGTRPSSLLAHLARSGLFFGTEHTANPPTTPRSPEPSYGTSTRKLRNRWGLPRRGSSY